jgi:hypothetical protein
LGDPAAEDSLRDFAKHVESISEEVPDCEGIASHDQIENGIPVDTPAESNIFPEESSDDSDDDLDIDIDEPEPPQPQPRLPQQLPCRTFESEHRFAEPSSYIFTDISGRLNSLQSFSESLRPTDYFVHFSHGSCYYASIIFAGSFLFFKLN